MGRSAKQIIDGKLVCSKCRESLPRYSFQRDLARVSGYCSHCKKCDRFKKLKSRYKINREDAELILEGQSDSCAICTGPGPLVLDHCHKTKKTRGFLCTPCNVGLGFFRDQAQNLRRAAEYLEKLCYTKKLLAEH